MFSACQAFATKVSCSEKITNHAATCKLLAIACSTNDCYKPVAIGRHKQCLNPELSFLAERETVIQHILRLLGYVFVGLGVAGVFLPLVPTTPFLLVALACFARSSPAVHDWLINHRTLGPYIVDWERDRSIPLPAKLLSVIMMSASLVWLAIGTDAPAAAVWITGGVLACVAAYILTRPTS